VAEIQRLAQLTLITGAPHHEGDRCAHLR
jgi:hypothetical protein